LILKRLGIKICIVDYVQTLFLIIDGIYVI
jgi:hypothetical protein